MRTIPVYPTCKVGNKVSASGVESPVSSSAVGLTGFSSASAASAVVRDCNTDSSFAVETTSSPESCQKHLYAVFRLLHPHNKLISATMYHADKKTPNKDVEKQDTKIITHQQAPVRDSFLTKVKARVSFQQGPDNNQPHFCFLRCLIATPTVNFAICRLSNCEILTLL